MHEYLHRSVKWGVNHFTYMVINTQAGTKWVSKLAIYYRISVSRYVTRCHVMLQYAL